MKQPAHKRIMHKDEPAVDQGIIGKFELSWNPDNNRYYVTHNGETVATFKDHRNATQYARTH